MVTNSELKATVLHSYFKGHYYLIEALLDDDVIFLESKTNLEKNTTLYLEITK